MSAAATGWPRSSLTTPTMVEGSPSNVSSVRSRSTTNLSDPGTVSVPPTAVAQPLRAKLELTPLQPLEGYSSRHVPVAWDPPQHLDQRPRVRLHHV
jgi:hypothetical protein